MSPLDTLTFTSLPGEGGGGGGGGSKMKGEESIGYMKHDEQLLCETRSCMQGQGPCHMSHAIHKSI